MKVKHLLFFFVGSGAAAQSLETTIQRGHELAVVSLAVSPDSNYVATGSKDKTAKLWDLRNGREIRTFLGHEKTVNAMEFSSDGRFLITGSYDKTARIWDVVTGKEIFSVIGSNNKIITDIAADPKMRYFVMSGYSDSGYGDSATVYDWSSKKALTKIHVDPDKGLGTGVDIAFSADGNWIGFGEDNRTVNIYRTSDWQKKYSFTYDEGWCGGCGTHLVFSPDSKWVYTISQKGPLKKYDMQSGSVVKIYETIEDDLSGLAISADGKMLARSTEKEVVVWNESNAKEVLRIKAEEQGDFHEIQFAADNQKLIIASDNNTASVWNLVTGKKEMTLTGLLNERDKGGLTYDANFVWQSAIAKYVRLKNKLMITKDGKQLIKGKFGSKVKRWDIATGQTIMEYVGHKKAVLCYDMSDDGKLLLTGDGEGKVILWDLEKGDSLRSFKPHREPIFDIQFSHDETTFACSSWDATLRVYDLKSGKTIQYFDFENSSAYNLAFHPSDLYLFTAQLDFSLQMRELDTRTSVRSFVGHSDVISSVAVSPDGSSLLSTSWDGSMRLWDIGTGLMVKKFKGHRGAVHYACFSKDGKQIYSAGADRVIRLWNIESAKVIREFAGHQAEVTSLLISPDEKTLISHDLDGVTKLWDLNSGKEFFEHIHLGERDWMVKTPDGYFNGTDKSRKYIHFVDGLKTYSVDQFFDEFYRPDLLPKLFQNRGGEEKQNLQGKIQKSPPPGLKIAAIPGSSSDQLDLFIRLTDNGAGVNELKIFHNGKSILIDKTQLQYPKGMGQTTTYKQVVKLIGGTNTFSATVMNKDKIESDPQTLEIFSDAATRDNTCYLLAVGINQYKNPRLNLNYAKPDAESFIETFNDKSTRLFGKVELHTLFDGDASRDNILKKLDELSSKIHPEDVFIFYYAGHGSMVDNRFFFIPAENLRLYDLSSLQKEGLEATILQDRLKNIKALKQLIVMDACQSGGSVELLATRGAAEEKAIAQLSRSAGIHVMASAGSEQFAAEFTELGHGLFTYLFIKALQGDADGAPKDGKVTIYELKSYLDDQVPELTKKLKGKPQYPYTFSRGQDFPLVLQEEK